MMMTAGEIIAALSAAYGGRSQWGPIEAGNAVYGQSVNNGLKNPEEVLESIASRESEYWEEDPPEDNAYFLEVALATFRAAYALRMEAYHAWVARRGQRGYAAGDYSQEKGG